jgi:hypothetical protein
VSASEIPPARVAHRFIEVDGVRVLYREAGPPGELPVLLPRLIEALDGDEDGGVHAAREPIKSEPAENLARAAMRHGRDVPGMRRDGADEVAERSADTGCP